jgi:hypothetical protein
MNSLAHMIRRRQLAVSVATSSMLHKLQLFQLLQLLQLLWAAGASARPLGQLGL